MAGVSVFMNVVLGGTAPLVLCSKVLLLGRGESGSSSAVVTVVVVEVVDRLSGGDMGFVVEVEVEAEEGGAAEGVPVGAMMNVVGALIGDTRARVRSTQGR
jgi:hypothetical protein